MTAAEWGRAAPGEPTPAVRAPASLAAIVEYAFAGLVLLLLSGAVLSRLVDPAEPERAAWLRTLWLPVYGLILAAAGARFAAFSRVRWGALLLAPLLLLAFASIQWSILPDVSLRRAVALGFTSLFGLWLAARFEWRELLGLIAGAFLALALASVATVLVAPGWAIDHDIHPGAWKGLWDEKNSLGRMMTLGALACACAAAAQPARRLLWGGAAALCVALVAFSHSTTSLLGLLVAGAALITAGGLRRGGVKTVATAWAALTVVGVAGGLFALAPDFVFGLLGKDASLTGRTEIWDAVLRQVHERPWLGYGYGAFWADREGPVGFVRSEVDWLTPTAHNGWLELLLGVGWVGAILFAVHLLVTCASAVWALARGREAYWIAGFIALFVLFSLSESTILQQNDLSWALYVMTAAKLLQRRRSLAAPDRPLAERTAPAARLYAPAQPVPVAPVRVSTPAVGLLAFGAAVFTLLIFSKTWMLVMYGGVVPSNPPGALKLLFLPAYGIGLLFALQRLGDAITLPARAPVLVLLVVLAGASTLWSLTPQETAVSAVALAATVLVGASFAMRFEWPDLTEIVAAALGILTVGSVVAALLAPTIGRDPGYPESWRGVWFSKNSLGGNMAQAFVVFCAAAVFRPQRGWLWWPLALLSVVVLMMSGSTTAVAAWLMGAGAFLFVALARRSAAASVFMTYAALLGFGLVLAGVVFAGDALLAMAGKDATLTGRTEVWQAALRQLSERPLFGFGYSAFWSSAEGATAWVRDEAGWTVTDAHNAWLEIWLGLGLVGMLLWSVIFAETWLRALVSIYRHGSAYLAVPLLVTFSVTALTESVALRFNELYWLLFVALSVKLLRWGQDPMAGTSPDERATSASP